MISQLFILSALAFFTVAAQESLVVSLLESTTEVTRIALLPDDAFKFDFLNPPSTSMTVGSGGFSSSANSETMPATIGNDVSITAGFLGPCSMNTPHIHPRSAEFNYVTNGSLITGMILEDGAKFIFNEVKANQAALFPQGSIHFEYNDNCESVTFVASFRDSSPGVSQVAQRFFGLPTDVVAAALGIDPSEVEEISSLIPDNVAHALEECTTRCGINREQQPTKQHQNHVPPSNSSSPNNTTTNSHSPPPNNTTNLSSPNNTTSGDNKNGDVKGSLDSSDETSGGNGQNKGLIIGLAVVGVIGLGCIAFAAFTLFRRRRGRPARGYVSTGESFAPGGMYDSEKYEFPSESLSTPYDPPSGSH